MFVHAAPQAPAHVSVPVTVNGAPVDVEVGSVSMTTSQPGPTTRTISATRTPDGKIVGEIKERPTGAKE